MKSDQNIRGQPEKKKNLETEKREKRRLERKKTTRTSEKMEIGEKKSPEPRPAREPRPRASEVSSLSLWSESLSLGLLCLGFLKFVYGYFGWYMILQIFFKIF